MVSLPLDVFSSTDMNWLSICNLSNADGNGWGRMGWMGMDGDGWGWMGWRGTDGMNGGGWDGWDGWGRMSMDGDGWRWVGWMGWIGMEGGKTEGKLMSFSHVFHCRFFINFELLVCESLFENHSSKSSAFIHVCNCHAITSHQPLLSSLPPSGIHCIEKNWGQNLELEVGLIFWR